jgi:branched-chain amino acid transport system permease protein
MRDYAWSLRKSFQGEILAVPGTAIAFFFLLFLFFVPVITSNPYILGILIFTSIYAIYGASWDFLSGFTGQVNFGHAVFFGVGAYATGLLNLKLGLPPAAAIPFGALFAVLTGLIVGIPALRLRGHYLALVTLAFPIMLTGVVLAFPDFTGGELGLYGISPLSGSRVLTYYISLIVMIASVLILWKLTDARSTFVRTGVILHAIREDEITARASGINTTKYKLLAFCISGFFAGIAGGLSAHFLQIAGPSNLTLFFSFQPIIWTIFGGIATIYGPVTGVYILYPLMEILRVSIPQFRMLIFALIVIFVLLFMPQGITSWFRDKIEVECPRCKLTNVATRQYCRACNAPLHLEQRLEQR